jgi:hypothetical protein
VDGCRRARTMDQMVGSVRLVVHCLVRSHVKVLLECFSGHILAIGMGGRGCLGRNIVLIQVRSWDGDLPSVHRFTIIHLHRYTAGCKMPVAITAVIPWPVLIFSNDPCRAK